jgi:hypothetical protein
MLPFQPSTRTFSTIAEFLPGFSSRAEGKAVAGMSCSLKT